MLEEYIPGYFERIIIRLDEEVIEIFDVQAIESTPREKQAEDVAE